MERVETVNESIKRNKFIIPALTTTAILIVAIIILSPWDPLITQVITYVGIGLIVGTTIYYIVKLRTGGVTQSIDRDSLPQYDANPAGIAIGGIIGAILLIAGLLYQIYPKWTETTVTGENINFLNPPGLILAGISVAYAVIGVATITTGSYASYTLLMGAFFGAIITAGQFFMVPMKIAADGMTVLGIDYFTLDLWGGALIVLGIICIAGGILLSAKF